MTKGRILLATFTFPPQRNGTCHLGLQYARGLRERGYDVEIVTAPDPRRTAADCEGFRVTEFDVTGNNRLGNPVRGQVRAYLDYLLAYDGDLILFNGWHSWPAEAALAVTDRLRATTVLLSQGTSYNLRSEPGLAGWARWLLYRPYAWTFARKMRCFDQFIFCTPMANPVRFGDKLAADRLGLTNARVIPNGANPLFASDVAEPGAFRRKYGIPAGKLVLCLSNYVPSKGQTALVRAFLRANPPGSLLVLAGSEFNDYSRRLARLAGSALNERVFLLEKLPQPDIRHAYRDADLFATATYMDAQPLMLIDAMAAGTPFLAREVGCVAEFPGGETFTREAELRAKLVGLLADDARRAALGRAGRQAVREYYDWPASWEKYDRFFEELIAAKRAERAATGALNPP
jgi:glycosyltransferase involved in cell wall biosynthesis